MRAKCVRTFVMAWASEPCCRIALQHQKVNSSEERASDHRDAPWISYLLATERGQRVAFWKALVKLYRFGVYSASLEPNLTIESVKNEATLCTALGSRPDPALHPELLQSRVPNLTKIQYDHHWNPLFNLYRLVPSLRNNV